MLIKESSLDSLPSLLPLKDGGLFVMLPTITRMKSSPCLHHSCHNRNLNKIHSVNKSESKQLHPNHKRICHITSYYFNVFSIFFTNKLHSLNYNTISYFTLYLAIYHKHCEKSLHSITFHYKLDIVILHNFALINRAIIKTVFHAFTYYFLSKDP